MKITVATVRKLIRKWSAVLSLDPYWTVRIKINDDEDSTEESFSSATAYVGINPRSWQADMTVNAWNIDSAEELEESVVHELLHVLLVREQALVEEKLGNAGTDQLESTNDKLARAFMLTLKTARRQRK